MRCTPAFLATCLLTTSLFAQHPDRHPYRPGFDALEYDITMVLPDTGNVIDARAVITVRRYAPGDTLVLDLLALQVDQVTLNGREVHFGRDATTVRVPLPSLPAGRSDTSIVTLRYGGPVSDGLIVRKDSLGRWTYFGDNWPDRGRNWIPSIDHPSDKATVTWTVQAPSTRKVVANGLLVSEKPVPGTAPPRTRTEWRENEPIATYLMVIAAAPLEEFSLGETACGFGDLTRCVPQSVYVAPEVRDFLPGPFRQAGDIVAYFSELVGKYPYEKLAHLESSTRFGGMENASAIFYSDRGFRTRQMGTSIVAHETAHQWFGDAVTEETWPHLWLSEGFATYFAALWTGKSEGDSAFCARMGQIRQTILNDDEAVPRRPVIDTIETDLMELLNRNSYEKGGFVLHMLRNEVGDSAFFEGLRRYYAKYKHANARSDDLRREIEDASGRDLEWFFAQWLTRPGYPEVSWAWSWSPETRQVTMEITQGRRFGAFRFPLTVAIRQTGTEALMRTRVNVPAQQTVRVVLEPKVSRAPLEIVLDPDVVLLAKFEKS